MALKYTVRVNEIGTGYQVVMYHFDSLAKAMVTAKKYLLKNKNYSVSIWGYY